MITTKITDIEVQIHDNMRLQIESLETILYLKKEIKELIRKL